MLADELDYVIGVDTHRDTHALAVVEVRSGEVVVEESVAASSKGYAQLLRVADLHAGRRAFAVEGTGSFGAGLTRFLSGRGERVLEVGRLRGTTVGRQDRCVGRDPGSPQRARPDPAGSAARVR